MRIHFKIMWGKFWRFQDQQNVTLNWKPFRILTANCFCVLTESEIEGSGVSSSTSSSSSSSSSSSEDSKGCSGAPVSSPLHNGVCRRNSSRRLTRNRAAQRKQTGKVAGDCCEQQEKSKFLYLYIYIYKNNWLELAFFKIIVCVRD